jgi:uncharacterized protein (DUF488 family)
MNPLFTIGHSTHELPRFLDLLRAHGIQEVADVRSQPYSRHTPWFSRDTLERALKLEGIRYVFLGRELGARRDERDCYIAGKVSYDRIAQAAAFRAGLARLQQDTATTRVALMCAEKDPLDCHRTILVARHAAAFAQVFHIRADGTLEAHTALEHRMRRLYGLFDSDLFLPPEAQLTEAYTRRGEEIAYVEEQQAMPSALP